MPDEPRTPFEIRHELVHDDLVTRTGFGASFKRPDYGAHGTMLIRQAQSFRQATARTRDTAAIDSVFVGVRTPEGIPIRQEKTRLHSVGLDVVSYWRHDPSGGTARISKSNLDDFEGQLLDYAVRPGHPKRSYFSVIEGIEPVPAEEKIADTLVDVEPETAVDCIVYVQSSLTETEQEAILKEIAEYAREHDGEVLDSHRFSSGIATALLRIQRSYLEDIGRAFNTVREIRPNRAFYVGDSTRSGRFPTRYQSIRRGAPLP